MEVINGDLICPESSRKFPVTDGIPNMLLNEDEIWSDGMNSSSMLLLYTETKPTLFFVKLHLLPDRNIMAPRKGKKETKEEVQVQLGPQVSSNMILLVCELRNVGFIIL